jgi:peptidoglycan/LPS O-acetylase OafA/YrhL
VRRIPELDALRGIAALAIVVFHLNREVFFFGWVGVNLFFVLSGYLITSIILRHGGGAAFFRSFFARRALRIWPIYYLVVLAVVAMNLCLRHPFSMETLPLYLMYTQNVEKYWGVTLLPAHPAILHTWTLAIEEQFYILWPLLLLLTRRRLLPLLGLAVVTLSTGARTAGLDLSVLVSQADGFALGGLLAALLPTTGRPTAGRAGLSVLFGVACCAGAAYELYGWLAFGGAPFLRPPVPDWPATSVLFINLFFFGVVGLVLLHAGRRGLGVLRVRPLCYLGLISYGIYLYHPLVLYAFGALAASRGFVPPWWVDALLGAFCVAVAAVSWVVVERPILALKDRFRYPAAAPRVAEPAEESAVIPEVSPCPGPGVLR